MRQTARRMALVLCPECGKQMSDQAPSCPHCGYAPAGGAVRFAAVGAATPDAGRRETVIWEGSPSLKLLLIQVLLTLIVATAAVVAAILVHPLAVSFFEDLSAKGGRGPRDGSPATLILMVIVGSYLVIRAIVLSTSVMRLRTTRYRLTNQRLVVEQGILSRTLDEVDLRTVDDSGFSQSPLERLQGIGTVWVVSSDRSTPRLTLRGIPDPRSLREKIRENAYRMSQGQVFTRST